MWRYAFLSALVTLSASAVIAAPNTRKTAAQEDDSPHYTNSWAVEVPDGPEAANAIAQKYQFENRGQAVGNLKNIFHFVMPKQRFVGEMKAKGISDLKPLDAVTDSLKLEDRVGLVEQQARWRMEKKGYSEPADPFWSRQWSLLNTGQATARNNDDAGNDLNVEPAWIQGYTGCGSVVGVVDDGVGYTNDDLQQNYNATLGYDYADYDEDPFPVEDSEFGRCSSDHGTCCAGEIAMAKSNSRCGVGVAYQSTITGIRLLGSGGQTGLQEASAIGHMNDIIDIYSNSWGPSDFGFVVAEPGILMRLALEEGATNGRDGKGSIFVWAAGNGGRNGDSCAADGYTSSIYTIGIGSAASDGTQAFYDEQCSGKMAVVFVNNPHPDGLFRAITTTADGGCNLEFDGTSAACPLVSGVMALVLEANPSLTWRDVQYLIAYTSNPDILVDGEWTTNGAGLQVSHKFGFGAIDAEAMVTRAQNWINVPGQQSDRVSSSPSSRTTSGSSPVELTFSYSGDIEFTEHVIVTISMSFDIDYSTYVNYYNYFYYDYYYVSIDYDITTGRGDIQVELISPSGTRSVIFPYRPRDGLPADLDDYPLMSVHFWGEDPSGTWTMIVNTDMALQFPLTVSDVSMTVYGTTETPEAVAQIPSTCDSVCARGCAASGPQYCDACASGYVRDATTLECISECPSGYAVRNEYCYDPATQEPQCFQNGGNRIEYSGDEYDYTSDSESSNSDESGSNNQHGSAVHIGFSIISLLLTVGVSIAFS